MNVGKLLRKLRAEKKWTVEEAARKAKISVLALNQYEQSGRMPRDEVKKRLGQIYQVDPGTFLSC